MKSWARATFLRSFGIEGIDSIHFERSIVLARVLLGILMTHKYLDTLGFTPLCNAQTHAFPVACVGSVAGICLTLGLLTPVTLIFYALTYVYYPPVSSLVEAVLQIPLWGLLVLGAGKSYSLDALLARRSWGQKVCRVLYGFALPPTASNLAVVRFFLLFMLWGICVNAMFYHFSDEFWLSGAVLQIGFATPYLSDYYHLANRLRETCPAWYVTFCVSGLLVQCLWEMCLVPLMLFRWGRLFVLAHGLIFFTASAILLNLQYLPLVEFCLWVILFGPHVLDWLWRIGVRAKVVPTVREKGLPEARCRGRVPRLAISLGIGLTAVQLATLPNILPHEWHPFCTRLRGWLAVPNRHFGQVDVNVFNVHDMQLGSTFFVLYEVDEGGHPLRVVPFLDGEGGRLHYLRNDLLYFNHSLRWQRSALQDNFENADWSRPTAKTMDLIKLVAVLDAKLTDSGALRHYRANFYQREMDREKLPNGWRGKAHRSSCQVSVNLAEDLKSLRWTDWIFDLPPGQLLEQERIAHTWKMLLE
jgi:hypothetical protein